MKILIISDAWHPQVNGVVRTYENISLELIKMGHTVKVIGPSDFPWSFPMFGYPEIRMVVAPDGLLKKQIDDFVPDIFHIATEGPLGQAARKYAIKRGIKFTTCYHTHFPDYVAKRVSQYLPFLYAPIHNLAVAYIRHFHAKSACIFVATQSLKENLLAWKFTAPMKFMTRGVDQSIFYVGEKILFQSLLKPVALYVGRVSIEKNLPDFLDMPWQGSKVVVGHGPDLEHLKNKYSDALFTGKKIGQELGDHYRSADVFVFPSRTDTFGMVLIEAMACGLPVAGYPVTGPIDIMTQSNLGCIHDDLSYASQMALTCGDGLARAEYIQKNYTWEKAARQFLGVD